MDEDKLLPHVENLVPGFVTLLLLAVCVPAHVQNPVQHAELAALLRQPVIATLFITATAYLTGVVVFVASRLIVDTASTWTFRWILLLAFDGSDFRPKPGNGWRSWLAWLSNINAIYFGRLKKALDETSKPLARREVIKRRERARHIRTALLPAAFLGYQTWGSRGFFLAFATVVLLYAYAEVAVYREAKLAA